MSRPSPDFHHVPREELLRRISEAIKILAQDPHWCEIHDATVAVLEYGEDETPNEPNEAA